MDIDKTNSPEIQNPCNAPSDKAIAQALPNEFDFEQWYIENAFDYERNPICSNECWIARKAWHAALRAREIDAAEPQGDGKGALYHATNRLMQVIGEDGEVDSRHAAVTAVMDALKAIDGGQYQAPAERAENVATDINLSTLRFLDGGVVKMDISDYRRLAAEQGKDRKDADNVEALSHAVICERLGDEQKDAVLQAALWDAAAHIRSLIDVPPLGFIADRGISLIREADGTWSALKGAPSLTMLCLGSGRTPNEAIDAAMAQEAGNGN